MDFPKMINFTPWQPAMLINDTENKGIHFRTLEEHKLRAEMEIVKQSFRIIWRMKNENLFSGK